MEKISGSQIQNQMHEKIMQRANAVLDGKDKSEVFSSKIENVLKEVANTQTEAEKITKDYELGRETDLTKVIMKQQVANIAFQMTLNVRNKVLSSYKDIMNMPL